MTRKPKTSTLNNFTTAWNRVIATAVERGFISERVPVPKLTAKGLKGKARPGFSEDEIKHLMAAFGMAHGQGVRYTRIWVDGKTGGRWHIAKHRAVEVLKRLYARQRDICRLSFGGG